MMSTNGRRRFMKQTAGIAITLPILSGFNIIQQDVIPPKILFRLGWDPEDNDDIAIIPSLCRIAQKSIQNCEFYLWLDETDSNVIDMLNTNFTNLKIITGDIDDAGEPTSDELRSGLSEAALFFYSTGAAKKVDWADDGQEGIETRSLKYCFDHNIPYAVLGLGEIPEEGKPLERFLELTNGANYIFITSSYVDKNLKDGKIKILNLNQIPNPLFAFDLRNDTESRKTLESFNLIDKDFLCIDFRTEGLSEETIKEYSEKLVMLITSWVENTNKYVLILPNNPADIELTQRNIYSPLSDDIKSKISFIQKRLTPDTAASIYEKSRIVSGMSLFPACSAIHAGVPVFFLASMDSDTVAKTIQDLGLKNSIQELSAQSGESLCEALLEIDRKYVAGIYESTKASENAMKKLSDQFADISKFINKSIVKENSSKKKDKKQ